MSKEETLNIKNSSNKLLNKWAILFTVLMMTFMATFDSTIVNVALPMMQKCFGVGLDEIQWVASIYLITICASMLIFGSLGDMIGKSYIFEGGIALFSFGSLLCGFSHTYEFLLFARCVQGIGAAAAMANNMGIITETFDSSERGHALGLYASFVALGMMCGPVIGGFIISYLKWECIFLINVPIGVLAFCAGLKTLPFCSSQHVSLSFDIKGAFLLVPALILVLMCAAQITSGITRKVIAMFIGCCVLIGLFFNVEKKCTHPLVNLSLFRDPVLVINATVAMISFLAIGSTEIVLPFYLQDAHGFQPNIAGLLFAVIPLVNAFVGPLSGAICDKVGSHGPTCIGLIIYAMGIALVGTLTATSNILQIIIFVAFMSFGTSMFQPANNNLFMDSAPHDALGFMSSFTMLVQNMGMSIGISVGMALLYNQMSRAAGIRITKILPEFPEIFQYGFRHTFLVVALLVGIGALLCCVRFLICRYRLSHQTSN